MSGLESEPTPGRSAAPCRPPLANGPARRRTMVEQALPATLDQRLSVVHLGRGQCCPGRRRASDQRTPYMATMTPPGQEKQFGATARRDAWWLGPLLTFLGLLAFVIYANYVVFFVPGNFEIRQDRGDFFKRDNRTVAPYLAPFSSPLLYDAESPHS